MKNKAKANKLNSQSSVSAGEICYRHEQVIFSTLDLFTSFVAFFLSPNRTWLQRAAEIFPPKGVYEKNPWITF